MTRDRSETFMLFQFLWDRPSFFVACPALQSSSLLPETPSSSAISPNDTFTAASTESLESEVIYLHHHFFHSNPPPEVIERYIAANRLCLPDLDESSRRIVSTVLSRHLDVEAVEAVLRVRHLNPVLTRKIQILFYLVEVRSSYYPYFVNSPAGTLHASLELLSSVAQTAWKLVKGVYLIRRHGLV